MARLYYVQFLFIRMSYSSERKAESQKHSAERLHGGNEVWSEQGEKLIRLLSYQQNLEEAARLFTQNLVEHYDLALARMWYLEPASQTLELMASAGASTKLTGRFARIPLGSFKMGWIAQNHQAFWAQDVQRQPWIRDPWWVQKHNLQTFCGYPLMYQDQCLGVVAFFTRQKLTLEEIHLLHLLCSAVSLHLARLKTSYAYQKLTPREQEVLQQLLLGQSNQQIAQHLNITVRTVKYHLGNLFQKYGVSQRFQLIQTQLADG
jgi:DNA-binding CsgD family transcriptional regulator